MSTKCLQRHLWVGGPVGPASGLPPHENPLAAAELEPRQGEIAGDLHETELLVQQDRGPIDGRSKAPDLLRASRNCRVEPSTRQLAGYAPASVIRGDDHARQVPPRRHAAGVAGTGVQPGRLPVPDEFADVMRNDDDVPEILEGSAEGAPPGVNICTFSGGRQGSAPIDVSEC